MKNTKLSTLTAAVLAALVAAPAVLAQSEEDPYGTLPPAPENSCPSLPVIPPFAMPSPLQFSEDGVRVIINSPHSLYAPSNVNDDLPTNLCQTVYSNSYARRGNGTAGPEIPNTLPSTPERPYNLHPDPALPELIDSRSPTQDLRSLVASLRAAAADGAPAPADAVQFGLDILEGNPIDREYSGFPLLHYNGPNKVKKVQPIFDPNDPTKVIGGNVEVHQIWWDTRIMSNAALIDPSDVLDVPWTITYKISVLEDGREDFAPFVMYLNGPMVDENGNIDPTIPAAPGVSMDQTFFPVEDGTRTTFEIAHAPGRQYRLTYSWGWRRHPSRIQASENALTVELGVNLADWDRCVFGDNPMGSEEAKLAAISMLSNLAPAKRIWNALRELKADPSSLTAETADAIDAAFQDWRNRTKLPSGIERNDDFNINLVYLNNTLYGDAKGYTDDSQRVLDTFNQRGDVTKVLVRNGDYFDVAQQIVDFGGIRGWENIYQNTIPDFGAGPWFTFGKAYWWPLMPPPIGGAQPVPHAVAPEGVTPRSIADCQQNFPASQSPILADNRDGDTYTVSSADGKSKVKVPVTGTLAAMSKLDLGYALGLTGMEVNKAINEGNAGIQMTPTREAMEAKGANGLGLREFEITHNYEPSKRLKIYMFDQIHHDVAIWSIH